MRFDTTCYARVHQSARWSNELDVAAYLLAATCRRTLSITLCALTLAACAPDLPPKQADRYDTSKMDLKPAAAALSSERHSGAFSSGAALRMTAVLKPLDAPQRRLRYRP